MMSKQTEAQRLVEMLVERWGLQAEGVAYRLRVSLNTVMRWRRGVQPQPGHLANLRDLVDEERRRRDRKKATA